MGHWRDLMAEAEAARQTMMRDRAAGEAKFDRLIEAHPNDGMLYFKRGEGYEALREGELAVSDYHRAESLFPMVEWQARARQAAKRLRP
jgi:tetratricopeptide (TPR) repeat protein